MHATRARARAPAPHKPAGGHSVDLLRLDEFRQDIMDYAGQFTLPYAASKAIGNIKRSVQSGMEIPLEYHLALERELQSDLFQSGDAKKGIAAYVNREVPEFEGN